MKDNRINLRMICALSSILLVSNGLYAMTRKVRENVKTLLATKKCKKCDLRGAFLTMKNLRSANLEGANLEGADLQEAKLNGANLKLVELNGTNLNGANLGGANLEKAQKSITMPDQEIIFSGAILDKNTTLPSGKKYSK